MAKLAGYFTFKIGYAKERSDELAEAIQSNPAFALEQSCNAFETAATWQVCSWLIENRKMNPRELATHAATMMAQAARYPESSTSVPANFMDRCILAAWAKVAEDLTAFAREWEAAAEEVEPVQCPA